MKDPSDLAKFIEKYGWKKGLLYTVLYTLVIGVGGGFWGYNMGANTLSNSVEQVNNFTLPGAAALADESGEVRSDPSELCEYLPFEENRNKWDAKEFSDPNKEGFYCPKFASGFPAPDMWLKDSVSLDVKKIKVVLETRTSDQNASKIPSFVVSLGSSPRIFRLHVPEVEPQVIGFEKKDLNFPKKELVRDTVQKISDPIQDGTETEVVIRPVVVQGNSMNFYFDISYISDISGKVTNDTLTYDVSVPFTQPSESSARFGIGAPKGICIKPIKYAICK